MPENFAIGVECCSWVLQEGSGSAAVRKDFPESSRSPVFSEPVDFSVKGRLKRVKGYLDPASQYLLGAASFLSDECMTEKSGIAVISQYGAAKSSWTFYEQLKEKGPRLASPMIFPHGYVNTAANLLAIEYQVAGPHMVFSGVQKIREIWEYAACRLMFSHAPGMLIGAYEAVEKELLPAETPVRNGALCLLLRRLEDCAEPPLAAFQLEDLAKLDPLPDSGMGQVENLIRSLELLTVGSGQQAAGSRQQVVGSR